MRLFQQTLLIAAAGFLCSTAFAQTKVGVTISCAKPDPHYSIPVGDRPVHTLGLSQSKCVWKQTQGFEGDVPKDGVSTSTSDATAFHGVHVATHPSGDKTFASFRGTAAKDGSSKGTWAYSGGTGKYKRIKGKGTFTCAPDPSTDCEIEGEYELPK